MGRYFDEQVFGQRLLELMQNNNDTTYSLAEHLHLSSGTIFLGKKKPGLAGLII